MDNLNVESNRVYFVEKGMWLMIEKKKSRINKSVKDTGIKSISEKKSLFADSEEMEDGINRILGIMDGKK